MMSWDDTCNPVGLSNASSPPKHPMCPQVCSEQKVIPTGLVVTWGELEVPYEWDTENQCWVPTTDDRVLGSLNIEVAGVRITNQVEKADRPTLVGVQ